MEYGHVYLRPRPSLHIHINPHSEAQFSTTCYDWAAMTDTASDETLMLLYREGEAGAFDLLYARHKAPLYRYLVRQLQDSPLAEELFQDIWMRLINARESYEPRASFRTFLYHLAHNRLIDHYRREGHMLNLDDDCLDGLPAATSCQPEAQVAGQQAMAVMLELIQVLPEEQREAFLLKEEAGLSLDEIADITNVNRETAKSRLRYAIRRLREGLRGLL